VKVRRGVCRRVRVRGQKGGGDSREAELEMCCARENGRGRYGLGRRPQLENGLLSCCCFKYEG
jgi:hypothetical protein